MTERAISARAGEPSQLNRARARCELLHHDLVRVPGGTPTRPGIYWLRLFARRRGHVAVVTEVPGNPGQSVTNAMSGVIGHLTRHFGVDVRRLQLYEVWPRGVPDPLVGVKRIRVDGPLKWSTASRREIEELIGRRLPPLPRHGVLRRRVRMAGGAIPREVWRSVFEALLTRKLPPPHNPSRCDYIERFHRIEHRHGQDLDDLTSGRKFLATLSRRDAQACRFHQANWKAIADESVRILKLVGRADSMRYTARARRATLPAMERRWLVSLFADPIVVAGGRYTNGQHRGCALRFSGAARAAVVTRSELAGVTRRDWTYLGGG